MECGRDQDGRGETGTRAGTEPLTRGESVARWPLLDGTWRPASVATMRGGEMRWMAPSGDRRGGWGAPLYISYAAPLPASPPAAHGGGPSAHCRQQRRGGAPPARLPAAAAQAAPEQGGGGGGLARAGVGGGRAGGALHARSARAGNPRGEAVRSTAER